MPKKRSAPSFLLPFLLGGSPCHPVHPAPLYGHPAGSASAGQPPPLAFKLHQDLATVNLLGDFGLIPEEIRIMTDGVPLDFTLAGGVLLQVRLPDWQPMDFHFTLLREGHPPLPIHASECRIVDTVQELMHPHSDRPEEQAINRLLREAFPSIPLPFDTAPRSWQAEPALGSPGPYPGFTPPKTAPSRMGLTPPEQALAIPSTSSPAPRSRPESPLPFPRLQEPSQGFLLPAGSLSPSSATPPPGIPLPELHTLSTEPEVPDLFIFRGEHLAQAPVSILVQQDNGPRSHGWVVFQEDRQISFYVVDPRASRVRIILGPLLDQTWTLPPRVPQGALPDLAFQPEGPDTSLISQAAKRPDTPPADPPLKRGVPAGTANRKRPRPSPSADASSPEERATDPGRKRAPAVQPRPKTRSIGPAGEIPSPSCAWAAELFTALQRSADMLSIVNALASAPVQWVPSTELERIFMKRRNGQPRNAGQQRKALLARIREINKLFLRASRKERIEPQSSSLNAFRLRSPIPGAPPGSPVLTPSDTKEGDLMFGPLLLRPSAQSAGIVHRTPLIKVTKYRWKLLETLLRAEGRPVSGAELGQAVYGTASFEPDALRNLVMTVRNALGIQPQGDLLVILPRNEGYSLQLPAIP